MSETETTASITFGNVAFYTTSFLMIFAPIVGYIHQFIKFRKLNTSEGYSSKISLILLISNTLRIFFWFGKKFSIVLIFQSIVMMIMQIVLLIRSLQYKSKKEGYEDFTLTNFWEWPYYSDYFHFLTSFVIFLGILTPVVGYDNTFYFEILGILSATTEASLQIPQIYKNFMFKSANSLSYLLVATWLFGDAFKSGYLIIIESPIQMVLCGVIQVLFDLIIILQVIYYNRQSETKTESELRERSNSIEDPISL